MSNELAIKSILERCEQRGILGSQTHAIAKVLSISEWNKKVETEGLYVVMWLNNWLIGTTPLTDKWFAYLLPKGDLPDATEATNDVEE